MAASFFGSRRQGIHRALIFVDLAPHSTPHVTTISTMPLPLPAVSPRTVHRRMRAAARAPNHPSPVARFTGVRVFDIRTKTCLYTHRSLSSHRCLSRDCSRTGSVDTRTHSVFVIPHSPHQGGYPARFVCCVRRSGAAGTRTPDLRRARAALSQLSYDPICFYRRRSPLLPKWARLDSNQGPRSYQDRALTT